MYFMYMCTCTYTCIHKTCHGGARQASDLWTAAVSWSLLALTSKEILCKTRLAHHLGFTYNMYIHQVDLNMYTWCTCTRLLRMKEKQSNTTQHKTWENFFQRKSWLRWYSSPRLMHSRCDALPTTLLRHVHVHAAMDLNSASWAASVAQLVELQPRMLKIVGSNPIRGSNFAALEFDLYRLSNVFGGFITQAGSFILSSSAPVDQA